VEVLVPSKTKKQAKFMAAVANNPKFAKKAGVPQSVGREYVKADKGRNFVRGGNVMPMGKGTYGSKVGRPPTQKYSAGRRVRDERNLTEEDLRVERRKPKDKKERKDRDSELARIDREEREVMFNKGGKVRGCGIARQGVRPAKMVKMS
jgi:hypothetical protein